MGFLSLMMINAATADDYDGDDDSDDDEEEEEEEEENGYGLCHYIVNTWFTILMSMAYILI
jgi:hypothetical protein